MYELEDPELKEFLDEENDEDTHADLLDSKNSYRKIAITRREVDYP
jgi:hypothetical protein